MKSKGKANRLPKQMPKERLVVASMIASWKSFEKTTVSYT